MMCNCCKKQILDPEDIEYCEICVKIYCKGCTKLRMEDIGKSVFVCKDHSECFEDEIKYIKKYGIKKYRR